MIDPTILGTQCGSNPYLIAPSPRPLIQHIDPFLMKDRFPFPSSLKQAGLALSMLALSAFAVAQDGALDPEFGGTGLVLGPAQEVDGDHCNFVAVSSPAGITRCYGYATIDGEEYVNYSSFLADGTYSAAHFFQLSGSTINRAYGAVAGSGGAVYVVGQTQISFPVLAPMMFVARTDGFVNMDNSFSSNGYDLVFTEPSCGRAVAVDALGRVLVAGWVQEDDEMDFAVARYYATGDPDQSFNSDGRAIIDIGDDDQVNAIVIQPDGKIVLAGTSASGSEQRYVAVRLGTDGFLDLGFGVQGKAIATLNGGGLNDCTDMILRPDGSLLLVGFASNNGVGACGLASFTTNGDPDPSFGPGGQGFVVFGAGANNNQPSGLYAVALDGMENIVVGGYARLSTERFAVARLYSNGQRDISFGNNGVVTTSASGVVGEQRVRDLYIQPNHRIVAVGNSETEEEVGFMVTRYLTALTVGVLDAPAIDGSLLVYPTPLTDRTTIHFTLQNAAEVGIALLDPSGRKISDVAQARELPAGEHEFSFALPTDLASGVYHIVLATDTQRRSVQVFR